MLISTQVTAREVSIIVALTPGLSDAECIEIARDLRCGHRVELSTGVSIAWTGADELGREWTVWPARVPAQRSRHTDFSSLNDD